MVINFTKHYAALIVFYVQLCMKPSIVKGMTVYAKVVCYMPIDSLSLCVISINLYLMHEHGGLIMPMFSILQLYQ